MRLAEMLHRNNLKATFYIPRSIPSGVMPESQVRELSQSFEIGGHTLDHLFLPTIPDAVASIQIAGCKKWVEDVTGKRCQMFCPPAGRFNEAHRAMMVDAEFLGFRSVEFLSLAPPSRYAGLLEMPTTLQSYPHPPMSYVKNMIKRKSLGSLVRFALQGAPSNWEKLADRLLRSVLKHGGVFHLWGHSWEIEQTSQWDALDRVLALLGRFTGDARTATNTEICQAFASPC
jgi:peptidoglycan/xylan/chitin deacetylase (PgdA/CDA1 family)